MNSSVTILLPVRNAARTLNAALDSITAQTFKNFELLVIDDASSDASRSILECFAAQDRRCRIIDNPGHGLVAALNAGLALAGTELIARMDADDLMMPQRLAEQLSYLRANPGTAVLGSQVERFPQPATGNRLYMQWQNTVQSWRDIRNEIYVEAPFTHPSVMFRRDVVVSAGGYRDGDFPEDYELWLRLHQQGHRMEKLPELLLRWRASPTGLTATDPRYRRSAFDALRARYLAVDERFAQNKDNFVIWGAGRRTRKRCAHLLDSGFSPRAWVDVDPRKIGNRLDGVPVVSAEWLRNNRMFVLAYVANHGARADIAGWLIRQSYQAGRDFLLVG